MTKSREERLAERRLYNSRMLDVLDLIKRENVCMCCGDAVVQFDHIVPLLKSYKTGHSLPFAAIFKDLDSGNIQFLCKVCNESKYIGQVCRAHGKYLGLWNHLPNLENVEV